MHDFTAFCLASEDQLRRAAAASVGGVYPIDITLLHDPTFKVKLQAQPIKPHPLLPPVSSGPDSDIWRDLFSGLFTVGKELNEMPDSNSNLVFSRKR